MMTTPADKDWYDSLPKYRSRERYCVSCGELLPITHFTHEATHTKTCVTCRSHNTKKVLEKDIFERRVHKEMAKLRRVQLRQNATNRRNKRLRKAGKTAPSRYRWITYNGETKTLKEWARIKGVMHTTLRNWLDRDGMTMDEIMTMPPRLPAHKLNGAHKKAKAQKVIYDGKEWTIPDLARAHGMDKSTLRNRIVNRGMSVEEALTKPIAGVYDKYRERVKDGHLRPPRLFEYDGKALTLSQWAEETGIPYGRLHGRIYTGNMTIGEAINFKPYHKDNKVGWLI